MKGKLVAFFLFFSLVAPPLLTYTWMQGKKTLVRKELKRNMKAGLPREALVLLKFTKAESENMLSWKHAKEFGFQDRMFDVIDTEIKGDSLFFWCWEDHEENKLNKDLQQLLAQVWSKNNENHTRQKRLQVFLKHLFQPPMYIQKADIIIQTQADCPYRLAYQPGYTHLSYPPPKRL